MIDSPDHEDLRALVGTRENTPLSQGPSKRRGRPVPEDREAMLDLFDDYVHRLPELVDTSWLKKAGAKGRSLDLPVTLVIKVAKEIARKVFHSRHRCWFMDYHIAAGYAYADKIMEEDGLTG